MKNLKIVFKTESRWSLLIIRLSLGIMILPHGLQKAFGLFGGFGFTGTMNFFTETMGIPWIFAFLAIAAEFLGGLGLLVGLATRISALGVGVTLFVAMMTTHIQNGFFMNWFGNQKGEGIEFFILAIGLSLALILEGGGKYSVDNKIQ